MTRPVRHIVFDVGKVLLHWDPELAFIALMPERAERRWFLENVCTQAWNIEQDRGRGWPEAEAELIERFPQHETPIRAYRENWHLMVPHAIEESVQILRSLIGRNHDVTLLTNFAADTFAEATRRYDFLRAPRGATVSGRVGHLKPDMEIYALHAANFDLEPGATLFIDDSMPNVDGAIAAGWQAVHFEHPAKLRLDLLERGIAT